MERRERERENERESENERERESENERERERERGGGEKRGSNPNIYTRSRAVMSGRSLRLRFLRVSVAFGFRWDLRLRVVREISRLAEDSGD